MECSFCGDSIPEGSEVIFVTRKGKALYFCTSKCEKNMIKLGRKPRKVKWTAAYAKEKEARRALGAAYKPPVEKEEAVLAEDPAKKEKKVEEAKPVKKDAPKKAKSAKK